MKLVKKIILALFITFMIIPFTVKALDEKVNVYIFKGEGCPHCKEALEWFDSLDETTKDKINLVQYEVWSDRDNANLMKRVSKVLGDDSSNTGVPYIVIGDKSFIGFTESYEADILAKVDELYSQENRYDVMQQIDSGEVTSKNDSKAIVVIIVFVVLAGAVLIYYVSKSK